MTFKELKAYFIHSVSDIYAQEEALEVFFLLFEENDGLAKISYSIYQTKDVSNLETWQHQIERIQTGEPVQYILGKADFWGLKFRVSPAVLIPRPETEELVQLIVKANLRSSKPRILDIGTGTGCIALSLKKELPSAIITGLDVSEEALEVAKKNQTELDLNVDWVCQDIQGFQSDTKFDIIVSNPPYIPVSDKAEMGKNVLDFEPHLALFAPQNNPLFFYKVIGDFAQKHLTKPNGKLYFEAHHIYAQNVYEYFAQSAQAELVNDMFGKPRFIVIAFNND